VIFPALALLLGMLALVFFWQARRQKKAAGLPGGRVIYSDTRAWKPTEKPLYDPELNLAGKPDYLVQQGNVIIPVEVKSTRGASGPYDSHIFQLAAYCRLVESHFGTRPPYGLLHYPNRTFAIDFTTALEEALVDSLVEMRQCERRGDVSRSHEQPERCARCGFRRNCDQRLG
jgi:CRISPR-associated exonuclease Cas4